VLCLRESERVYGIDGSMLMGVLVVLGVGLLLNWMGDIVLEFLYGCDIVVDLVVDYLCWITFVLYLGG